MSAVTVSDLDVQIPTPRGVVEAVCGASLQVATACVAGLIGASGSGKSTVGRAMLGLVPPESVVRGTIGIGGHQLVPGRRRDERQFARLRGRTIAYVPQNPASSLTPVRRVGPQLQEIRDALGGTQSPAALLERVQLAPDVLDLFPHQLSGGMAQRVAIAFALAGEPDFLVADEPTSALDPHLTTEILHLLREVADDGLGVLVISHDLQDLLDTGICDTLSVMRRGVVVESGPARRVWDTPGHDYTRALMAALPSRGMALTSGFERG